MVWYQHFWLLGSSSVFLCQWLGLLCLIPLALFDLGLNVSKVSVSGNVWSEIKGERKISQEERCSLSLYIYIWLFSMAFFQLCVFGWLSFPVPALLISDSRVLPMLWHSAAVGTASSRDTCPFQEHSGSQHVCLLNTWHTGDFVMYQTC